MSEIDELADVFGTPADRLIDPITGSIVRENDPDSLYDSLERAKLAKATIDDWMKELKYQLASLCQDYVQAVIARQSGDPSTSKTFRVRGQNRTYKLEMPGDYWDYTALKKAWSDPEFAEIREELLAIDRVKVQMRPFKKAVNTDSDDETWMRFAKIVEEAFRGPSGSPMVSVDESATGKQSKGSK